MKIRDAINAGVSALGGFKGSRLNCEILLAHILGKSREYVFAHNSDDVTEKEFAGFLELVLENHGGRPIAYLISKKEFYGLDFYVDERVLIPRPETELLLDIAVSCLPDHGRVLDIGTGSGAIAISLVKKLPDISAVASDISSDALSVARINAGKHGVLDRIEFVQSDLLKDISGSFDVICANLPYIGSGDFVDENVRKLEPDKALFPGEDGLGLYKKLFQQLERGSVDFRYLIGEFGFGQVDGISGLLNKYFVQKWRIEKDLQMIPRVFIVGV